jgi:hypothetical protein
MRIQGYILRNSLNIYLREKCFPTNTVEKNETLILYPAQFSLGLTFLEIIKQMQCYAYILKLSWAC